MRWKVHRILVDDVALQLGSTGISRLWTQLLENIDNRNLAKKYNLDFIVLNRSSRLNLRTMHKIDFPQYDFRFPAADRLLISEGAKTLDIDVFLSTYFTMSTFSKNALMIYDLIPEVYGFDQMNRGWLERKIAILNASSYLPISNSTLNDLAKYYPNSMDKAHPVIYPGVDKLKFHRSTVESIENFRKSNQLKNYYVTIGWRYGEKGYKNGGLIYEALETITEGSFDLVFIGGEEISVRDHVLASKLNRKIVRLDLSDSEMVVALSGAEALLYPSLYEGFGMPPLEALALGVPVIVTNSSSIPEATGNLGEIISGTNKHELAKLLQTGIPNSRKLEIEISGPKWASNFSWETAADKLCQALVDESSRNISTREHSKMNRFHEYTLAASLVQSR
jgi:glycosyltransferase involved in cell wall biosynthesis